MKVWVETTPDVLERIANIVGPHSASARALKEYRTRRAAGEDVVCFQGRGTFIVGPRPTPSSDAGGGEG